MDALLKQGHPESPSVTLQTLQSAASAVGGIITIALEV
jgi:hypothetical protein